MKKANRIFASLLVVLTLVGLPSIASARKPPQMTPMELQALQSKEFETSKENLFNSVMTVVQDLGYQVQSADLQTGFVTAISATEQKTNFLEALGGARSTASTKMTAFVQAMPNGMSKVRLNFLISKMTSSAYGQSNQNDKPVLDAVVYRNAWDKIDEALFVLGAMQPSKTPQPAFPTTGAEAPVLQAAPAVSAPAE